MAAYGACHKIVNGAVDDCGEFEAKADNAKYCEACECHRSFHKASTIVPLSQSPRPGSSAGLVVNSLPSSIASTKVNSPASRSSLELLRRSPRQGSAKRCLNVESVSPIAIGTPGLAKKVEVEPISPTKVNPYARALTDLQKEFKQEGEGRFEFRKEGGAWRIWCCLCKNLNQVGPGPRKLGKFKKHFSAKKHLDLLRSAEEDANAKEVAAEAKVKARKESEEGWLTTWASEGGLRVHLHT
jgi:hypothetical protein